MISGKRTLSFIVQNEARNINKIKNTNEVAVFIVKMEYGLFNPLIEELRFDSYSNNKFQDSFPIGFFLYDLHNNGVDINFFLIVLQLKVIPNFIWKYMHFQKMI